MNEQQMPPVSEEPKKKNTTMYIIIGVVVLCCLLCCGRFCVLPISWRPHHERIGALEHQDSKILQGQLGGFFLSKSCFNSSSPFKPPVLNSLFKSRSANSSIENVVSAIEWFDGNPSTLHDHAYYHRGRAHHYRRSCRSLVRLRYVPEIRSPEKGVHCRRLPLYNETNDLDGPIMLRQMFDQKLRPYYRTAPLETVDEILRDQAGISLGGQLGMIKPQKLGEILGVDGLVYGYLLNFEDVKTVFYNVRKVRAAFKLVDVKTGKTVWARGQGVRSVGGMLDVVPADENLQDFMKIKDIEKIPGVNQWHDRVNIPSMIKEDPRSLFVIPFIAAADTVLSLFRHIAGNMAETHLYSFADEVTGRIVYEVVRVRYNLLDRPAEARKLIFPVLAFYQDVDFTAKAILRVQNMSTGEESVSNLELKKKGCLLRSERVAGENRFTLIVDSAAKKGQILFPESGQYKYLALNAASF